MATHHTVEQGECLSSIAAKFGFADWHTIYDHPSNADLKSKRPNPNILYPGDELYIPDPRIREEACQTEKIHKFALKAAKATLRLVLKDRDEKALANKKYALVVEGKKYYGSTDSSGLIEQAIPVDAKDGKLTVWVDPDAELAREFKLQIGHLDPAQEVTGVQARLNNLGFSCGDVDGAAEEKTKDALMAFQQSHKLERTGEADSATIDKLREGHDGT